MLRSFLLALLLTPTAQVFAQCAEGELEMSVESVEGIFCVNNQRICIANISDGACPVPQEGLEYGSYCGVVATGVYGCKKLDAATAASLAPTFAPTQPPTQAPTDAPTQAPTEAPTEAPTQPPTEAPTQAPTEAPTVAPTEAPTQPPTPAPSETFAPGTTSCPRGQTEISVQGAGVFCVEGWPVCVADVYNGACPGPQPGLENGSYCGIVAPGVYGCKVKGGATTPSPATESPTSAPDTPAPATAAPTSAPETPAPSTATPTSAPDTTTPAPVKPTAAPDTPAPTGSSAPETPAPTAAPTGIVSSQPPAEIACRNGSVPMSVEGVPGTFCAVAPICVANVSTGNCPGATTGLEWGSSCGLVRTNVYGCKPNTPEGGVTSVSYPPVRDCSQSAEGSSPVSVVGAGTFCASEPVCVDSQLGNCPRAQDGLTRDSVCVKIPTGVYGCVLPA